MSERARMSEALKRAIDLLGGPSAVGRDESITPQAVGQWDICPPSRVARIAARSGVPAHELRSDIFPPPADHPASPSFDEGDSAADAGSRPVPFSTVAAREASR